MANKVGQLIKEARTGAGLMQDALAKQIEGLSANEISRAERGELELPQAQLKAIAKLTGVTQKSLVEAAKESTYKTSSTAKTAASGKTASAAKSSGKTAASSKEAELSAAEKKFIELYRSATAENRKKAEKVLKGEEMGTEEIVNTLLGTAVELFAGKKK